MKNMITQMKLFFYHAVKHGASSSKYNSMSSTKLFKAGMPSPVPGDLPAKSGSNSDQTHLKQLLKISRNRSPGTGLGSPGLESVVLEPWMLRSPD